MGIYTGYIIYILYILGGGDIKGRGKRNMSNYDESIKYLRAIKNPYKRAYGFDMLNHLFRDDKRPERPPQLSYLAAQAVRMTLNDILADKSAE